MLRLYRNLSIALEDRLLFGGKGLISALKIVRRHANCLGLGFRFNGLVQPQIPFLMQHLFGHAVGKRGTGGKFAGQLHCG